MEDDNNTIVKIDAIALPPPVELEIHGEVDGDFSDLDKTIHQFGKFIIEIGQRIEMCFKNFQKIKESDFNNTVATEFEILEVEKQHIMSDILKKNAAISEHLVSEEPVIKFLSQVIRAQMARADILFLFIRFFCNSFEDNVNVWCSVTPSLLFMDKKDKSTSLQYNYLLNAMKSFCEDRRDCLDTLVSFSQQCKTLAVEIIQALTSILQTKLYRQDTLAGLNNDDVCVLRCNARGWIDDIMKITQDMDDTLRIPKSIKGIPRELLMGQKRFLYAFMDVLEECLQSRLGNTIVLPPINSINSESIKVPPAAEKKRIHLFPMISHIQDMIVISPFVSLSNLKLDESFLLNITKHLQSDSEIQCSIQQQVQIEYKPFDCSRENNSTPLRSYKQGKKQYEKEQPNWNQRHQQWYPPRSSQQKNIDGIEPLVTSREHYHFKPKSNYINKQNKHQLNTNETHEQRNSNHIYHDTIDDESPMYVPFMKDSFRYPHDMFMNPHQQTTSKPIPHLNQSEISDSPFSELITDASQYCPEKMGFEFPKYSYF